MVERIVILREFFFHALTMAASMFVAVILLHGLNSEMLEPLIKSACIFATLNACVRAIIFWKNLQPFVARIGMFTILVNSGLICFVLKIIPSLPFQGYSSAFWISALTSMFSWLINHLSHSNNLPLRKIHQTPPRIKQAKARVVNTRKKESE
ncbi:MAG: phage holin family protein [Chthoniobacterales bacterium]